MKWRFPAALLAVGVLAIGIGVLYGVVMVGTPTPGATGSVAAAESRDSNIAGLTMIAGGALAAVGTLWLVLAVVFRTRPTDPSQGTTPPRL